MIWFLFLLIVFITIVLYCCIIGGSENAQLKEYIGPLKIYTHYDQDIFKIEAEWPAEGSDECVSIHVYSSRRDPGTGKPQVEFLPHAILRVYKETGEVYDWWHEY